MRASHGCSHLTCLQALLLMSGSIEATTFLRVVVLFGLRWLFVRHAARVHFTALRSWQGRALFLPLVLGLYTSTLLYHLSFNTYTDRLTGRARVIVTGRHIEGQLGALAWANIGKKHPLLPNRSSHQIQLNRIASRLTAVIGTEAMPGMAWDFRVIKSSTVRCSHRNSLQACVP